MKALRVLAGCSLFAIATAAHAETVSPAAGTVQQVAEDAASSDESQANAGDIIVTANRREERLQSVPVAITLVDGGQLTRQNINSVENLTRSAPALNSAGPPGFGALSIRGIGSLSFSRSSEGSVGVMVDNVALANTSNAPPLLFDIARVEVLEGPQSTLFGRNASAGVVNIITNAPNPNRQETIAHIDIGSRNNYVARMAVNMPVASNAALRVAASFSQDPQVQHNLADDSWLKRESKAVRGRFLWEPSSNVTINLSGDYTTTGSDGGAPWAVYASSATSLLTQRLKACGVTIDDRNTNSCIGSGSIDGKTVYGFSGQVDVDLGGVTLTSISALRQMDAYSRTDLDSTKENRYVQTVIDKARNLSQELRLSTPTGGVVEGVAGLYYFNGKTANTTQQVGQILADLPLIGACPLTPASLCGLTFGQFRPTETRTESYAAFGQATVHAGPALRFILGARVGHEKISAVALQSAVAPGAVGLITTLPALNETVRDTYFSYRLGAQYDVSRDLMVFATYTRGYKGAAINDQGAGLVGIPLTVKPEIPKSAEVGFKSTFANGRVAFNATGFYTRVENFQAQFVDTSTGSNLFVFGNAPTFTVKGVSANLFGRPLPGLTVNLGAAYTKTRFGDGYLQPDYTGAIVDVSIDQPGAQFKGTVSTEYTTKLSDGVNGFIQADMVYNPRRYSNAAADRILSIQGAAIVGGRIGLRTSNDLYGLSLYARNLFDTFRASARFATPTAPQQLDPLSFSQFVGPESRRVIGLSLDARF